VTAWRRLWLIGERLLGEIDLRLPDSSSGQRRSRLREFLGETEPLLIEYVAAEGDLLLPLRQRWRGVDILDNTRWARFGGASQRLQELDFSSSYDAWWFREAPDVVNDLSPQDVLVRVWDDERLTALQKPSGDVGFRVLSQAEVVGQLFGELPLVARRLAGDQQELYLEASRMNGEVEFRNAVAVQSRLR
jgi:hypothetical protein